MGVVCRPEFSINSVIGLNAFNPCIEALAPMALCQVAFPKVGNNRLRYEVKVAHDAVPLILPHPCLNLLPYLVDGTKRAVELRERVVAALEIGATETIPGVVVLHLDVGQIAVMMEIAVTVKKTGTGVGGNHTFCLDGMTYNVGDRRFNLAERKRAQGDGFRSLR